MSSLVARRGIFAVPKEETFVSTGCRCHFIPPHLQKKLQQAADDGIRSNATLDDQIDIAMRSGRVTQLAAAAAEPAAFSGDVVIRVYDAKNEKALPGEEISAPAEGDGSARRAFEGAQRIYTYYKENHNRHSIDDRGMALISTVHYGNRYNNAFWNGRQMTYGDGDGISFDDFTKDFDVIAHEVTHGVVERTARLVYQDQPGALNESISDVMGICAKQFHNREAKPNWLIGDRIIIGGGALRSLKAPGTAYNTLLLGKDPQTSKMSEYDHTKDDNGGVHINSGIPNRAFYLAAKEMKEALGTNTWEKPAQIWYRSLLASMYNTQFKEFADTTIRVAVQLHGSGSREETAVRRAWETVEVFVRSEPDPAPLPDPEKDEKDCCLVM